jgi:hypothetical protein
MKKVFFLLLATFLFGEVYTGVVTDKYIQNKFGEKWLILNLNSQGRFVQVLVAPVSVMNKIGVKTGDKVSVEAYRPPMWPPMVVKAYDIFDNTQNKNYKIKGGGLLIK